MLQAFWVTLVFEGGYGGDDVCMWKGDGVCFLVKGREVEMVQE